MNTNDKNNNATNEVDSFDRLKIHTELGLFVFAFLALLLVLGTVGMDSAAQINDQMKLKKQSEKTSELTHDPEAVSKAKAVEQLLIGSGVVEPSRLEHHDVTQPGGVAGTPHILPN